MPALERAVLGMSEAASVVVDMAVPRPGFFPVLMGVLQRGVYKAPTTGPSLYGTLPLYRLSTATAHPSIARFSCSQSALAIDHLWCPLTHCSGK